MIDEKYSSIGSSRLLPSMQALKAFERAATLGSYVAAAEELGRTPSAVSHAVKDLERRFGIALFERTGRSIKLTDAGEDYLVTAQQALSSLRNGALRIRRATDQNMVRVSALPFFTSSILMPNYASFETDNPNLDLRIETTNSYADVGNNEVDIAIRFGTAHTRGLELIPLLQIKAQPICAPGLLENPDPSYDNLFNQTLIHVSQDPNAWNDVFSSLGQAGFSAEHNLTFDSTLVALDAVKGGLGIGLSMSPMIESYPGFSAEFVPASPPCEGRTGMYYIVCRKESTETDKIRRTIAWLEKSVEPYTHSALP